MQLLDFVSTDSKGSIRPAIPLRLSRCSSDSMSMTYGGPLNWGSASAAPAYGTTSPRRTRPFALQPCNTSSNGSKSRPLGAHGTARVRRHPDEIANLADRVARGCTRDEVEGVDRRPPANVAEHGKKFGVIIGVQNHGDFLKTSDEHLSLISRVDSPWCGPIVDTGYYKSDDPYRTSPPWRRTR